MATIRKRGSRWHVQIRRKGFPPITKSLANRADAVTWSRHQERLMDLGEWREQSTGNVCLHELLDRYRQEVSPRKRSQSDAFHLRQIARHHIARLKVCQLTPEAVVSFREDRLKTVAPATVRKELGLLSQVLKHAHAEWAVSLKANPVSAVRKPPALKGRTRRLDAGEAQRLIEALGKSRNTLVFQVVLFAIYTGMRRGEILSLTWENVDLGKKTAHLPLTKTGEARTVPLSPKALGILQGLRPVEQNGLVFRISANALRLAWERVKRRAGIEDLRFHDLRHEAISRFFEKGLSVPEVALISGHRDPRMLFRYTHLKAEQIAEKLVDG